MLLSYMTFRLLRGIIPALAVVLVSACSSGDSDQIEARMSEYDSHIRKMDADAIAQMYTPDGWLGEVQGRDSIAIFLKSFSNVNLVEYETKTMNITVTGDSAIQEGRYRQVVIVNPPDTLFLSGDYETKWRKIDGQWYVRRMGTTLDEIED